MTFDELNNQKNELTRKITELRADMEKNINTYLVEHYIPLFDKYPDVYGITWSGYTPYFNDGDSCEYSSHHEEFSIILKNEDGDPDEDVSPWESSEGVTEEMDKEFHDHFPNLNDDDMLCFYGDHVQVTLTRDGVEVDHYEHD